MKKEKGFTLIELLVVVAIIGILAAIAIPQFAAYRVRAFNSAAVSDLRTIATGEEAYFVDNETYATSAQLIGTGLIVDRLTKTMASAITPTSTSFTSTTAHPKGNKTYTWNSTLGGLQ